MELLWQANHVLASLGRQCHIIIFTFTTGPIEMWLAVTRKEQRQIIRSQSTNIWPYITVSHESASRNHRPGLSKMQHLQTGKNMKMVYHLEACRDSFCALSCAAKDAGNEVAAVGSPTACNQIYVAKIIKSLGTEFLSSKLSRT